MRNLEGSQQSLFEQLVGLQSGDVFTVQVNGPGGWCEGACNYIEQSCFAGAVGANQTGDGALFNAQRCAVDGANAAEMHVQVIYVDHWEVLGTLEYGNIILKKYFKCLGSRK